MDESMLCDWNYPCPTIAEGIWELAGVIAIINVIIIIIIFTLVAINKKRPFKKWEKYLLFLILSSGLLVFIINYLPNLLNYIYV